MFTRKLLTTAVALAWASGATAQGIDTRELERLRAEFQQQMQQMQRAYEARLTELESRLRAAESRAPAAPAALVDGNAHTHDRLGEVSSGSAFNPRISVILDGVWYADNKRGKGAEIYQHIDGITHAHGDHDHPTLERGFNLRETEIAFSATVSPYFDANLYLAVDSGGGVEVEEAYFDTRALPGGLKLRGGRFLSGIGYLNGQHPHTWDFVDQNLPYRTLLGEHGLRDTGLQLTWTPRTGSLYSLVGAELLQGRDHHFVSGAQALPDDVVGLGHGGMAAEKAGPRLLTTFVKLAPDLGDSHAVQFGLSYAKGRQLQEVHDHRAHNPLASVHGLQGDGWLWGGDLVYKFDAPGAYGQGDVTLAAEYLRQRKDLTVAYHQTNAGAIGAPRKFTQDGAYLQAVYGFAPHWQIGARYDITGMTNKVDRGTSVREWETSDRWTVALTRHLTEFSRLRLQASRAKLWEDGEKQGVNQIFLQYQHSLGSHGAHKF
jgi:hypothetical protein